MPSRHSHRRTAAALGTAGAAAALALGSAPATYAAFSDFGTVSVSATAGVWQPDPPAACGDVSDYQAVLYVTTAQDIQADHGKNIRRIIVVTVADPTTAVNIDADKNDCIVTGPGTTNVFGAKQTYAIVLGKGTSMCSTSDLSSGSKTLEPCTTKKNNGDDVYPIANAVGFSALSASTPLAPKVLSVTKPTVTPDPTSTSPTAAKTDTSAPTESATPTPTPTPTSGSPAAPTDQPSGDTSSATDSATASATITGAATTESSEGGQS